MKLHSTIIGEGKPFLILHGFLGMGDNWKTMGKGISELGYQVHLLDQRNHGRSPHSEEMSYMAMAEDLKEYWEDHSLNPFVLMGHSMGGKTAMWVARYFPELVERIIVVDIAPRYYSPHHQQILEGLGALERSNLSSRGEAEEILSQYVPEKSVQLFLLKNLYWKSKGELALRMNLEVLSKKNDAVGEALPEDTNFRKPALFIKGAASGYISGEDREDIAGYFPNSQIITIPDAGHWVHAEQPEEFFGAVKEFLSESFE